MVETRATQNQVSRGSYTKKWWMSGTATLVTCRALGTSGVTLGPCLVISPIGENKADSFSPYIKPTYRTEETAHDFFV